MDDLQRRPGRPRKWSSDTERMRAYRARERERTARLVDPLIENVKLRERIVQLEAERDRLWAQVVRVQGELRASATAFPTTSSSPPPSATDHQVPGPGSMASRVVSASRVQSDVGGTRMCDRACTPGIVRCAAWAVIGQELRATTGDFVRSLSSPVARSSPRRSISGSRP